MHERCLDLFRVPFFIHYLEKNIMKEGDIKTVDNRGLKFDLQATDEEYLMFDEETKKLRIRRLGIVVTDVPENKYGIKRGSKMLMSD